MTKRILLCLCALFLLPFPAFGSDVESRLKALEDALRKQQQPGQREAAPGLFGGASLLNPNISAVLNTFVYTSDVEDSEHREIPGYLHPHSEAKKGFNLESVELYIFAPVDPYFNLYVAVPVAEDGAELEEAYFVTTALPKGFQVKGGKFKSGFGRLNSQHPHQWDFADAPLPYRAFTGDEGVIEKGIQLTYLPNLPVYTLMGIEALQGENEVLLGKGEDSGPNAYAAFVKASFDVGKNATLLFGPSVLTGKTKTGSVEKDTEFQGDSTLYGFEATYKWKPSKEKTFVLQSEYFLRDQSGELEDTTTTPPTVDPFTRKQDGLYVQGKYRSGRWGVAARYDVLDLFNADYVRAGTAKEFGPKPWRATAALEYNPSEFSRIRLQYNHDESDRSGHASNEVFLQFIVGIGAHAAHTF